MTVATAIQRSIREADGDQCVAIYDMKTDPPPDLAIEAVYSHDADQAIEVYRRLKVPEVWVCDETELRILFLQPNGRYAESASSASFPFLTAAEVYDWVRNPQAEPDSKWVRKLRAWVKRTLKPRARNQSPEGRAKRNPTTKEPKP